MNEVALEKLRRYCVYQDRCHQEVRHKLLSIKVYGDELEEIITELIKDNFLNEERFARSYARGKFRMKKWGKNKIKQQLKLKNVSAYCIKKGLEEIEDEDYILTLKSILQSQLDKNHHQKPAIRKQKVIKYAISRGYETNLVLAALSDLEMTPT